MKRVNVVKQAALGLATVGMIVAATASAAPDTSVHAGQFCQPARSPAVNDIRALSSRVYNSNGSRSRTVTCPIVRDRHSNNSGAEVRVRVNRSNATNNALRCTLRSLNQYGGLVDSDTASTALTGNRELCLSVSPSVANNGYYAITCSLPARSSVYNYKVVEAPIQLPCGGFQAPGGIKTP